MKKKAIKYGCIGIFMWFVTSALFVATDNKFNLSDKIEWFPLFAVCCPIIIAISVVILQKGWKKGQTASASSSKKDDVQRGKIRISLSSYLKQSQERKRFESLSESEQYMLEKAGKSPFAKYTNPYHKSGSMIEPEMKSPESTACTHVLTVTDNLFSAAMDVVLETGMASISMIQRQLQLGYGRTARIMDEMEALGLVGPFNGSIPRTILISKEDWANTQVIFKERPSPQLMEDPVLSRYGDDTLTDIDSMEGHDFEYWCASLLKKVGFTNVEVTKGSGDQGVDILAVKDGIKYAIQCKCYSSDLGNKPIQEVNTGRTIYHCQIGAVMTNRYFTQGGIEAAKATGVLLWDRDWIQSKLNEVNI